MARRTASFALLTASIALSIGIVGAATVELFFPNAVPSPVWPPAGIAFTALYVYGLRGIPGVFVGALFVTNLAFHQHGQNASLGIGAMAIVAAGATAQALVSMWLTRRFVGPADPLTRPIRITRFMVLAGLLGPVINASVGTWIVATNGNLEFDGVAQVWRTWWTGDAMGVVFFAPLALMLLPSQREIWHGRRLKVAVPTLLAVLITLAIWSQQVAATKAEAQLVATQRARVASVDLRYHASTYLRVAKDAAGLFLTTATIDPKNFSAFTKPVLREEGEVLALEWLPLIGSADLASFEAKEQRLLGIPSYRVRVLEGKTLNAALSDNVTYTPIAFAASQPEYAASLGLDLSSSPRDAIALESAVREGAGMTQPFTTTAGLDAIRVVRLVVPVFRTDPPPTTFAERKAQLRGFVTVILGADELVHDTYERATWNDAQIRIVDTGDPSDPQQVSVRPRQTKERSAPRASAAIEIASRQWTLWLAPGIRSSAPKGLLDSEWILLLGMLVAALLESFVLVATGLQRHLERRVRTSDYAATHDPLTDLTNRRAFFERLGAAHRLAREDHADHVLMAIDLDGFKAVNDGGGHAAGDEMLRAIAVSMREQVRQGDTAARLGGDEFAVLLPNCPLNRGLVVADSILRAISEVRVASNGEEFGVTASIGVLYINAGEPAEVDELMARADTACYEAKRNGKSQIRVFQQV